VTTATYARSGQADIFEHMGAIVAYKATLMPPPEPVNGGTFRGGMLWRMGDKHYVVILLPPCGRSYRAMSDYLGEHFDGEWNMVSHETFGDIEAIHLTPPWAA
jgi:hypothetical protein